MPQALTVKTQRLFAQQPAVKASLTKSQRWPRQMVPVAWLSPLLRRYCAVYRSYFGAGHAGNLPGARAVFTEAVSSATKVLSVKVQP